MCLIKYSKGIECPNIFFTNIQETTLKNTSYEFQHSIIRLDLNEKIWLFNFIDTKKKNTQIIQSDPIYIHEQNKNTTTTEFLSAPYWPFISIYYKQNTHNLLIRSNPPTRTTFRDIPPKTPIPFMCWFWAGLAAVDENESVKTKVNRSGWPYDIFFVPKRPDGNGPGSLPIYRKGSPYTNIVCVCLCFSFFAMVFFMDVILNPSR